MTCTMSYTRDNKGRVIAAHSHERLAQPVRKPVVRVKRARSPFGRQTARERLESLFA
ncbi:hypothetical protein ACJBUE_20785 (plasmid) [Ralstonia syzygii subsp. celebesensis]|uniref:Uncharacterized protein n=2 Tax=Ralstonia syzygii TaxID=28097 RepID=G2ZVX3_9RALS|nr:hypothetical protein [Ralstonia syzygii]QQV57836.1 hypothetical protein JK151_20630 [Ralstonia syzygii subsp. celebesensis]CCA83254.1 hypothetical protein BDB_mp60420 [blood disease bacterium R229]